MCIAALMYYPEAGSSSTLLTNEVTLDSGSGQHTCGCLAQDGAAPAARPVDAALAAAEAEFQNRKNMYLAHGVLMIFAWGLLLPFGSVVPRFWRDFLPDGRWLKLHLALQLGGVALTFSGFWVAFAGGGVQVARGLRLRVGVVRVRSGKGVRATHDQLNMAVCMIHALFTALARFPRVRSGP